MATSPVKTMQTYKKPANISTLTGIEQIFRRVLHQPDLQFSAFVMLKSGRVEAHRIQTDVNPKECRSHVTLEYQAGFREELFIEWHDHGLVWRRRLTNSSTRVLRLKESGTCLAALGFGKNPAGDYFYHAENPRIYGRMAIPVRLKRTATMAMNGKFDAVAGTRWADPGVVSERVGASPYQPFPAVLLSHYKTNNGLVHGTLSQRVFYHNHTFEHRKESVCWTIYASLKDIAWLDIPPGGVVEDGNYLGATREANDLERIFAGYTAILRKHLPATYGATNINRHSVVWGSWNDGVFRDIDERRLVKMAAFLKRHLPTVAWMQIDDGYSVLHYKDQPAHGLGAPYEGTNAIDRTKFPHGLKSFTDRIRLSGLRPAIWIGGAVPAKAPLAKAHPDWFLDYSYRLEDKACVLDVSKPEVRRYMVSALDFFLTHSGFEGMKHDFWSYAFEDSHALLANHDKSGYQWRTWWLTEIRKRLPRDGYLQTGCDIVMGNPFLGEFFTNYRYGIDIGSGDWDAITTNFQWGTACFATHTGDLFVPNSDSIGMFPGLTNNEMLTSINYCLISRSMAEVAGWLYKYPRHPRFKWVRKALCCPNNGQDVFFAGYDYRDERMKAPPVWFLNTPHFSLQEDNVHLPARTVALFNLEDTPRTFTVDAPTLRLPPGGYTATNVWSLRTAKLQTLRAITLPGRTSRLFAVNRVAPGPQIFDADIKILDVQNSPDGLTIEFAFGGSLTLVLSARPARVVFNNRRVRVSIRPGAGNWILACHLPTKGTMRLSL